ncbi:MAG TPA: UvrB/UvrC motif-containing protein, partial [Candidatus Acidoferrales bacterium]|nr:UvrB/UvrC motif-containing protein [Candidatus Acidoferrales bacterium]
AELEGDMLKAAEDLQFEKAALLRDQIKELKRMLDGGKAEATLKPVSYNRSSKTTAKPGKGRRNGKRAEMPF